MDVAIVGGGIAGLTAAFALKRAGRSVAVIERNRVGYGETGHTTAHLTEVVDPGYVQMRSDFGVEVAAKMRAAHRSAIDTIEGWATELGADCAFERVPGYLFATDESQLRDLEHELEALQAVGAGARRMKGLSAAFRQRVFGAVELQEQARFHPMKYLLALANAVKGDGCHLFEKSQVLEVEQGDPGRVCTSGGEVVADQIFLATDSPIAGQTSLHTRLVSYRTYAIALRLQAGSTAPKDALYWDLDEPYNYLRKADGSANSLWILGGADHRVGSETRTESSFDHLESVARKWLDVEAVTHRWSGQVIETVDGLPFVGLNPGSEKLWLATGFSGNGMTNGTIAGVLVADQILGRPNSLSETLDPSRVTVRASVVDFVKHNAESAAAFVMDKLRGSEAHAIAEIPRGQGMVLKIEGEKLAVYRDLQGKVSAVSAICTHMGCQVHFNSSERSWDCPCHGSRFGTDGKVLHGPARECLARADLGKSKKPKSA